MKSFTKNNPENPPEETKAGIALSQEKIGDKPAPEKIPFKKDEPQGIFKKVYFNEHGISKHYLKFEKEQKEITDPKNPKLQIMVFADGTECAYFENLSKSDIESYKLF